MDAILKLCILSVSILFLSTESQGYCSSNWDCPSSIWDSDDERYCCGSSVYSYCCDWNSYVTHAYDGDDDSYSYDYSPDGEVGDNAIGLIMAITFGVIGSIVFIVVLVAICVCCWSVGGNSGRTTTTLVYPGQAAPVAMVGTSNASSSPYYNTQQPPPYTASDAGQGGHVNAMKY
ncbi:uncharacterized protein [Ptychodera flava]|uniref:uncharacterized protein n=1 Tax=Ptychodera flava TaxID=63121 RepID=UPI00396A80F9